MHRRALAATLAAASLALFFAVCASRSTGSHAEGSSDWPKVSPLRGGTTVSVWQDGRVIQRDRRGRLVGESFCGSYARYQRWVEFISSFRAAVLALDRGLAATRAAYPLRWNHGVPPRTTTIDDRDELVRRYAAIFRPAVVTAIRVADPRALFCRDVSMVMLGSGVVWGDEPRGHMAVVTINTPAR